MNGLNSNYVVEGQGDVIVFIHGLSDNLIYWEILANSLKKDFKVIRFDLRGHGETPLGSDEITIDTYVNDLKDLLEELNVSKVNLVGFSLGGMVAQKFAVSHADMISSLVLMSTLSKCDGYLNGVFEEFKENLLKGFEEFYDFMIPKVLYPEVIRENGEGLEVLKMEASKTADEDAYIKAAEACFDFDVEDELSRIDVPSLIFAGRYDDIVPLMYQENLQNNLKNSKLIVIDNAKHNLLVGENNLEIINILDEFLKNKKIK